MSEQTPDETVVAGIPETGNAAVDEALQRLDGLADRPVTEHAGEFEAIHDALRDALDTSAE